MSEWPFRDANINAVQPSLSARCTSAPFCDGKREVEADWEWRPVHLLAQAGLSPRGVDFGPFETRRPGPSPSMRTAPPPVCTSREGRGASEGERGSGVTSGAGHTSDPFDTVRRPSMPSGVCLSTINANPCPPK